MTSGEYITNRLDKQISWYESKSKIQKNCYYILKILIILCTSSIPVFSIALSSWNYIAILTSLLAAIASISEGILSLIKFHDKWINYRQNAERLKREKFAFLTQSGSYSDLDGTKRFSLLVEQVESIISDEVTHWTLLDQKKGAKSNGS